MDFPAKVDFVVSTVVLVTRVATWGRWFWD